MKVSELENANKNLSVELASMREKLKEVERSRDGEKMCGDALNVEVENLHRANQEMVTENETLKAEVQKGVEEIAGALGDGYNRCLERVSGAGFDGACHHFEDYIHDFAASQALETQNVEGENN